MSLFEGKISAVIPVAPRSGFGPGLLPKNWSRCYESLRATKARRTLDETDATQRRADHHEAARRGWDAGGRPDDRRGLPGPGNQRGDLPALAPPVRRHEG